MTAKHTCRSRRFGAAAIAAALAATIAGCSSGGSNQPAPSDNLGTALDQAVPRSVLDLPLTKADGQTTTLSAYRGKIVVLGDSMTLCQEICPLMGANFAYLARKTTSTGQAGNVQFIELTIDPARDTPARLTAYRKLFAPAPANWSTLTGPVSSIAAIWKYFGAAYVKVPEDTPPAKDWWTGKPLTYDIQHTDLVVFLDGKQHERYLIDEAPNTAGRLLPEKLMTFLSADGRENLTHPQVGESWTPKDAGTVVNWIAGKKIAP